MPASSPESGKGLQAALLGALLALAVAPAQAFDTTNVAFVQTVGGTTSIPVGHAEFCQHRPDECRANPSPVAAVPLTEGLWQQLLTVNAGINQAVIPVTDQDLYRRPRHIVSVLRSTLFLS